VVSCYCAFYWLVRVGIFLVGFHLVFGIHEYSWLIWCAWIAQAFVYTACMAMMFATTTNFALMREQAAVIRRNSPRAPATLQAMAEIRRLVQHVYNVSFAMRIVPVFGIVIDVMLYTFSWIPEYEGLEVIKHESDGYISEIVCLVLLVYLGLRLGWTYQTLFKMEPGVAVAAAGERVPLIGAGGVPSTAPPG